MPKITVNDVGAIGIVADTPPEELPFNAWTAGKNVRMSEGKVERFLGHLQIFDPPTVAPHFLMNFWSPVGTNFWLLPGLQKVYVWDGSAHTNITRQSAGVDVNYSATAILGWTGGLLGDIPVINNGVDDPQQWSPQLVATKLAALSNWPASTKCAALRVFGRYLVALDVTKSGTRYSQMVKWSHRAAAGAVPSSWDPTDSTIDAAEFTISETNGACLDCAKLKGNINIVYKEDSCYIMQYVGGNQVFDIRTLFSTLGMIGKRCMVEIPEGRHVVFALDDVVVHNGSSAQSILVDKLKKRLFSTIDSTNFKHCFLAHNAGFKEVWICYPETGSTYCNKAIIWNYEKKTLGMRDLPNVTYIDSGSVDPDAGSDAWSVASGDWQSDTSVWGEAAFNPAKKRMLMAAPADTKLYYPDAGNTANGTVQQCYVERTGLGIPFEQGSPPDLESSKFFQRIWPRITGTNGAIITVTAGIQEVAGGPVEWAPSQNFTIGTQNSFDVFKRGKLLALRFESNADVNWALQGYQVELRKSGTVNV